MATLATSGVLDRVMLLYRYPAPRFETRPSAPAARKSSVLNRDLVPTIVSDKNNRGMAPSSAYR